MRHALAIAATLFAALAPAAQAKTLCTIIMDAADAHILLEDGDCRTRVTPASTFKVPLAVMGFDNGFLIDAHAPVLSFKPGDPDWGGEAWKQPTDPVRWLKYSVVWYSQRVTRALGEAKVSDYARRFGFGNADFSGDPGRNNGLDRAWIASSLLVSPHEQAAFLRRLVTRDLGVSEHAYDETEKVVEVTPAGDGWQMHGKTGTAYPRNLADDTFDETKGWGWYVGWAVKDARKLIFVRLDRDERVETLSTGLGARAALIETWPVTIRALRP